MVRAAKPLAISKRSNKGVYDIRARVLSSYLRSSYRLAKRADQPETNGQTRSAREEAQVSAGGLDVFQQQQQLSSSRDGTTEIDDTRTGYCCCEAASARLANERLLDAMCTLIQHSCMRGK